MATAIAALKAASSTTAASAPAAIVREAISAPAVASSATGTRTASVATSRSGTSKPRSVRRASSRSASLAAPAMANSAASASRAMSVTVAITRLPRADDVQRVKLAQRRSRLTSAGAGRSSWKRCHASRLSQTSIVRTPSSVGPATWRIRPSRNRIGDRGVHRLVLLPAGRDVLDECVRHGGDAHAGRFSAGIGAGPWSTGSSVRSRLVDDGRPVVLNARKQRALLVRLLLRSQRGRLGRCADRRGLGRAAAVIGRQARAGLRLPAAPRARRRRDRDRPAGLP